MNPQTFIFIGRSGSGKGTQVALLQAALTEKDPPTPIFTLGTGTHFREFIKGEGYTNKLSNEAYINGVLQPDFIAVHIWSKLLVENLTATNHLICDGITRTLPEAMVFSTAAKFYNRRATIIHLNVSRTWSGERLLARGRMDDKTKEDIDKRLNWFEKDTVPAIEYYRTNPEYTFIDVNGEQTIEDVHKEIISKLSW